MVGRAATFTVTFSRDAAWIPFLALSIERFCSGFAEHILVCDTGDEQIIIDSLGDKSSGFRVIPVDPMEPGHLWQEVLKVYADDFTDCDLIVHIDSDAIFREPVTPESFMLDGKPHLIRRRYEDAYTAKVWRAGTERALRESVPHEYMCRLGQMYRREDVRAIREYLEGRQGKSAKSYIMGCAIPGEPWGFSDFNVMGSIAARNLADRYTILTCGQDDARMPKYVIEQFSGATQKPTDRECWGRLVAILGQGAT